MRARRSSWFPAKVGRETRADYSFTVKWVSFFFLSLLVFGQFVSSDFLDGTETWQRARAFLGFISARVGSLSFHGLVFRPFGG
jgi:hypothetical protein